MVQQSSAPVQTRNAGTWVAILMVAPVAFLAAILYHPPLGRLSDASGVAGALLENTTRWGLSHLAVAVGSGLVLVAFLEVRRLLASAGENRWSAIGLPFVALGSTLFALLPGFEVGVMAAVEGMGAGLEGAQAAQAALETWVLPILLSSSVLFLIGAVGFAVGIVCSGLLSPGMTRVVTWALAIMALSRFVPLGAALYIGGVAAVVALWPLAFELRRRPA